MFEDRYAQIQYDSDNLENVTVKEVRDVPEGKGSLEDVVSEKLRETAEFVQEIVNREKNDTIPGNTGGWRRIGQPGIGGDVFLEGWSLPAKMHPFPKGSLLSREALPGRGCLSGRIRP